jgi:hypothetical protein
MNGRIVILDTGYQTVSVVQDLLEAKLGTGQAGYILRAKIMQSSDEAAAEAEELKVTIKKATCSFTGGSGGGTATIVTPSNSLAHGLATLERNNTTQAVINTGTLEELEPGVFNVLAGEWEFTPTPEMTYPIGPSEAAILSIEETPTDALTLRAILVLLITHG